MERTFNKLLTLSLSPKSDQHPFSPYIQPEVMRIKDMID